MLLRLAEGPREVAACQRLRYQVFYEELGATPVGDMGERGMDGDRFDDICDHLVVVRRGSELDAGSIRAWRMAR